jgi:hypothetical protein
VRRAMPPSAFMRTVGTRRGLTAYSSRTGDSRSPWLIASPGAYLCRQVALKFVPPETAEIESFCVPPDFIMISVGLKLPMAEPLAAELVKFAVPKLASGRIPPEPVQQGASTMTSADDRLAEDRVFGHRPGTAAAALARLGLAHAEPSALRARTGPRRPRSHGRVPDGALLWERPVRYAVRAGSCGGIPALAARA